MNVNVGSTNPVKLDAVRRLFERVFKDDALIVSGIPVSSNVPDQPKNGEVLSGAKNRAMAALGDADWGVGIEGGLIWNEAAQIYLEVQYCVIVDQSGQTSMGHGPGFPCPPDVIDAIENGQTLGELMTELSGIDDIGSNVGAIGFLSRNIMNRTELTENAVLMALIPRIRSELYE